MSLTAQFSNRQNINKGMTTSDIVFIKKTYNTIEYQIMKNDTCTNQNRKKKQKEVLFFATLLSKLVGNKKAIDEIPWIKTMIDKHDF